jgi:subtilase family serine protease
LHNRLPPRYLGHPWCKVLPSVGAVGDVTRFSGLMFRTYAHAAKFAALIAAPGTNNCATSATTLRVGWADLVTTAASDPPATALRGSKFTVSDTVRNQGTIPAVASTTRYYLSADGIKNAGDVLLMGARAVGSLDPSASSPGGRLVTVPAATPLGTYHVLACADDTGRVAESDNANNCRQSATTVTVQ